MKYTYTHVFRLLNIERRTEEEFVLISDAGTAIKAVVAGNAERYCIHGDRMQAFGNLVVNHKKGVDPTQGLDQLIGKEVEHLSDVRRKRYGKGPYLVVEVTDDVDSIPTIQNREFADFTMSEVRVEADRTNDILRFVTDKISAVVLALTLETGGAATFEAVSTSLVFSPYGTKPMYVYSGSSSIAIFQGITLANDSPTRIEQWYSRITAAPSLERILRLLVSSLQIQNDVLRSFLSAWNALEIFVNKSFPKYDTNLPTRAALAAAQSGELRSRRNKKSNEAKPPTLRDKFHAIAKHLSPPDADNDTSEFMAAKKMRDDLAHGNDIVEKSLPVRSVQVLVQKYVSLHLGGTFQRQAPTSIMEFNGRLAIPFEN